MSSRDLSSKLLSYGPDAAQHLSISWPARPGDPLGIVALIHGGYWRSHLDATLMEPLASSLVENGWIVANIEYRRGASGSWPAPLEDTRGALERIAAFKRNELIGGPLVSVGHSVGGELALLTGSQVEAIVALAPVTDVERTYRENLGDDAAAEYFGCSPLEAPEIYRRASPLRQLPSATKTLIVHGVNDSRVPIGHSHDYLNAAIAAASPVLLREYEALSHLEAINPLAPHWPDVLSWIAAISGLVPRASKSENA